MCCEKAFEYKFADVFPYSLVNGSGITKDSALIIHIEQPPLNITTSLHLVNVRGGGILRQLQTLSAPGSPSGAALHRWPSLQEGDELLNIHPFSLYKIRGVFFWGRPVSVIIMQRERSSSTSIFDFHPSHPLAVVVHDRPSESLG